MNLRPIETFGVTETLEHLRLLEIVAAEEAECVHMPERLPVGPDPSRSAINLTTPTIVTDPLAVFHFVPIDEGRLGLAIFCPHGDTLGEGFLFQRFAVDPSTGEAWPQKDTVLMTGENVHAVDQGICLAKPGDKPVGVSHGLASEISHGLAALRICLDERGDQTS